MYNSIIKQLNKKIKRLERFFMKYCAIIAEFNPFTNGHEYLLSQAKEKTGLNTMCIMSGNFVQRGELACLDKYKRATLAINAGADFVVELPTLFALSGAPYFAEGAIYSLMQLNCISHLAFGVELSNTDNLIRLAQFKVKESQTIKDSIDNFIKNGDNYSVASFKAYTENSDTTGFSEEFIAEVFDSPNNILALEYLTSIYKLEAPITPVFINRLDNGYNSNKEKTVKVNGKKIKFAGASHIRNLLLNGEYKKIKKLVPLYTFNELIRVKNRDIIIREERLSALVLESLRSKNAKQLESFYDYNTGLANLIYDKALESTSTEILVNASLSKRHRKSRLKKLVLYPLLGLTKERVEAIKKPNALSVLAIKSSKKQDISNVIKNSNITLIISNKDYNHLIKKSAIDLNERGSEIYSICTMKSYKKDLCVFVE